MAEGAADSSNTEGPGLDFDSASGSVRLLFDGGDVHHYVMAVEGTALISIFRTCALNDFANSSLMVLFSGSRVG